MNATADIFDADSTSGRIKKFITEYFEGLDLIRQYQTSALANLDVERKAFNDIFDMCVAGFDILRQRNRLDLGQLKENEAADLNRLIATYERALSGIIKFEDDGLVIVSKDETVKRLFGHVANERKRHYNNWQIILQTSLTQAVAQSESLITRLFTIAFQEDRSLTTSFHKTFTWQELQAYKSVEAIREDLIEQKVAEFSRKSLGDMYDDLKAIFKLTSSYSRDRIDRLREASLRRNLFAHNSGIINNLYLSKLPAALADASKREGTEVGISLPYVNEIIEDFEVSFSLLACEVWNAIDSGSFEEIVSLLSARSFQALQTERWSSAIAECLFLIGDKRLKMGDLLRARFNFWQAHKWAGKFDRVIKEIELFDTSACEPTFTLAWYALLDHHDKFFSLCEKLLVKGDLRTSDLNEWPIFKEMRKDSRYADLSARFEVKTLQIAEISKDAIRELLLKSKNEDRAHDEPPADP